MTGSETTERVSFPGAQGNALAARLDLPEDQPAAFALFAHCFTCSKDVFAASRISRALTQHGFAVLRFDFTGLGSSEGEFANTGFSSNVGDILAAADFLRREHQAPTLLVGHSLGGAAVLVAAGRIPEAAAVATINAPCDPAHVRHLFAESVPEIEARGEAEVELGGRRFRIRKQFLEDIAEQKMREAISRLGKALLIFHAPSDSLVSVDNARRIFEAAKHPKSFVSLDDADHLLTRREDSLYVATVLAAWSTRYIASQTEAERAASPPSPGLPPGIVEVVSAPASAALPPGTVEVAETGTGKFTQSVTVGRHTFFADEPASFGGDDRGPSPYELLSAALGACTSMTIRMYSARKRWPLQRVSVRLRHDKIHAQDCERCETKEGKLDRIEREIELVGDLDGEQRQRLLEIAEKCPVHRTLHSEIVVESRLRGAEPSA